MLKVLLSVGLISLSASVSFAEPKDVGEDVAVLVARAYALGSSFDMGKHLESEISKADEITASDYRFVILDRSGDCVLGLVVKKNGSIDQVQTEESCR